MSTTEITTHVAVVGGGPSGLTMAYLLRQAGIDVQVVENRSRPYTVDRVRAGVLEQSSVELLTKAGLGERLHEEGQKHEGIYLQFDGEKHRVPFTDLIGRSVWVYGQQEVMKDLLVAHDKQNFSANYECDNVALHNLETDSPRVTYTQHGQDVRITAQFIVGADGFHGISRPSIPESAITHHDRVYPVGWLGILANVEPSTDELNYALHEDGFAMHSMRSNTVSRLYLQVDPDDDIANWSDERIWEALQVRLGHPGFTLKEGPITEKGITPMRSWVSAPMRHGNLFLVGDSAHIVPPTGAKGLNSAFGDIAYLAPALLDFFATANTQRIDSYSKDSLDRIWRTQNFSMYMTNMLHRFYSDNPTQDDFDYRSQLGQLRTVLNSEHGMAFLAENYTGIIW